MRFLIPILLLSACPLVLAQASTSGTETSGPTASDAQPQARLGGCNGSEKIKPGESAENGDGLKVENGEQSSKTVLLKPKKGCGDRDSESTATTKGGFQGEISGVDGNDKVYIGGDSMAMVNGTGGFVSIGSGSGVLVTNQSETASMTIVYVTGGVTTLGPLSSGYFQG